VERVATIPQRELRNNVSEVLRRAEQGERFTITVDGRPVAALGPLPQQRAVPSATRLAEIIADAPVDPRWTEELARMRAEERAAAGGAPPG
jgi:prevent-host-death family protein